MAGAPQIAGAAEGAAACAQGGAEKVLIKAINPHLDITLADRRIIRLRGIRPPRGTKAWPELAAMARAALDGWIRGQQVHAAIEPGPADRWGRRLARIWLPRSGNDKATDNSALAVAPGLIEAGWAIVEPQTIEKTCLARYLALEQGARAKHLGLWSDPRYRPMAATDTAALKQRIGDRILVEGVVAVVRRWKSLTFINFNKSPGQGLGILLTRRARKAFERAGVKPETLTGKRLRVRGLLELSGGKYPAPRLRLPNSLAVELLP